MKSKFTINPQISFAVSLCNYIVTHFEIDCRIKFLSLIVKESEHAEEFLFNAGKFYSTVLISSRHLSQCYITCQVDRAN